MTNKEIFAVLRPHILGLTGVPECILYAQNQDSPAGEYASVQPRYAIEERGQANIYRKDIIGDQVETDVRPQIMVAVIVEFYRGPANERAQRLLQMGKVETVTWDLFKHKISIRNTSGILDLTALQSNNYEQRARIELYLWMESSTAYAVNNILGTKIIAEKEDGQVIQEINIDIRG